MIGRHMPLSVGVMALAVVALAGGGSPAAEYEPGSPSTYLFDTGAAASAALSGAQLATVTGWTLVPEDNLAHKFRGDVVIRNDRLIVVLRAKGPGAEVYGQTPAGAKQRVVLAPSPSIGGSAMALTAIRTIENSPAAVMLEATFSTAANERCTLSYRLTAGQALLEARPGEGPARVQVLGETPWVIVPDFFGDDMVFRAADVSRSRLRLPAENFFLELFDQGQALLMCVWQGGGQGATALCGKSAFAGAEISVANHKSVWIACLEGTALWHTRTLAADAVPAALALDWKPPFPARWRADLLHADGTAQAWYFRDPGEAGAAHDDVSPCCLEAGRAVVHFRPESKTGTSPRELVTYLMDRNPETPLAVFCPIDVLRNTLGVGPCQYILQTEGFDAESSPTPDSAMTWIERQFGRKKQRTAADEIRELLQQMVQHVQQAQTRIEHYGRNAHALRTLCAADANPRVKALEQITSRLEQTAAAAGTAPTAAAQAAHIAAEVTRLIDVDHSTTACATLGAEARRLGARQDRTLAQCRMAARWLAQSAAMLAEDEPDTAPLAKTVGDGAAAMLHSSSPTATHKNPQ